MRLKRRQIRVISASIAAVLQLATGVYALLATSSETRSNAFYIAAASCACYSVAAVANVVCCIWTRKSILVNWCLVSVGVIPLMLTGSDLAILTISQDKSRIGTRFCDAGRGHCTWAGDRALLTLFMLWFAAGLAQTIFTVLFVTGKVLGTPIQKPVAGRVLESPMKSPTPAAIVRDTTVRRMPLVRQVTSDEPFSYEEALQAKAASKSTANHLPTLSNASHQSNSTFVQSHISQLSYSRSWASTLPTAVSGASPRSLNSGRKHNLSDDNRSFSKRSSPEKEWSSWGIALSSPQHKRKQENISLSTADSATSSRPSQFSRSLSNYKFHLPSSPELREGLQSMPDMGIGPAGAHEMHDIARQHASVSTPPESPQRRKSRTGSFQLDSYLHLFPSSPKRHSRTSSTQSPERKRASILGSMRPRLPDARSFSRTSWMNKSANSSPNKSFSWHTAGALGTSPTDDAFAAWDTSTVERDLVVLPTSRDVSGSTPRMALETPREEHEESLWHDRDIRVASDGSVFLRDPTSIHKLSSRVSTS